MNFPLLLQSILEKASGVLTFGIMTDKALAQSRASSQFHDMLPQCHASCKSHDFNQRVDSILRLFHDMLLQSHASCKSHGFNQRVDSILRLLQIS